MNSVFRVFATKGRRVCFAALVAAIALSMAGCATPPPRQRQVETEVLRAPWSAYTIIPSKNYVVVGAIAVRNACNETFLAELMERAIGMGGHDLMNVRLAVTTEGRVTGATAVVIRYTDEPAHAVRGPSWAPLAPPSHPDAAVPGTVDPPAWPTQVISVPWAAYTFLPSKHYVTVGAIVLRDVNRATLLVDLMERAIEMGGHDIINVRLAVTERGVVSVATAVVIQYTDETVYVAAPVLPAAVAVQAEEPGVLDGGFLSVLPGLQRTPRQPRPPQDGAPANWLSLEVSTGAAGARYVRDINNVFSLGGSAFVGYMDTLFEGETLSGGISVAARFFPWNFPFYFELGLGVGLVAWMEERWVSGGGWGGGYWDWRWREVIGLMVTPSIGARFDLGHEGGFFLNPFLSLPVVIGDDVRPIFSRAIGVGGGFAW